MAQGKPTTFAGDTLKLYLNGTPIANIADNAASLPLTNTYVSLHTADPTASGNQTSNEVSYTSYARVAVARNPSATAWTVTGNSANPNSTIQFPTSTGGTPTATFWGVGVASSGAGKLMYAGPISPSIVVSTSVPPQLTVSSTITENYS